MKLSEYQLLLKVKQIPSWQTEAIYLLQLVTGWPKVKILTDNFRLSQCQIARLKQLAHQRQSLPLAYLSQNKEFFNLDFYVNEQVLIPRPESEDLLELTLGSNNKFQQVYDIGCGSGCLGISYIAQNPSQLILLDKSAEALKVARINCLNHNIHDAIFQNSDLEVMTKLKILPNSLILANLPYLDINKIVQTSELNQRRLYIPRIKASNYIDVYSA